jgi:transposase
MVHRKVYTDTFKRDAVRLARERNNLSQVARDLGVASSVLARWKKRLESTPQGEKAFPGQGKSRDEEMSKLQRENARLKEENEILKKAVGIFTKAPR